MANDQQQRQRRPRQELVEAEGGEVGEVLTSADMSLAAGLTKAEIDQQIATAKRYPRMVTDVMRRIETLATLDETTAAECIYNLPRDGKQILGPSVRFAEIVMQCWGNCRVAARVTNEGKTHLEATGIYHDLETNMAVARSVPTRITKANGQRYGHDMIGTASAAATSKALRNAVLAGVPKGVWRVGYEKALAVARGTAETLTANRAKALKAFADLGVKPEQVFAVLEVKGPDDITLDLMLQMRTLYTTVNTGEATIEELIAAKAPAPEKDRTLGGQAPAARPREEPKPAARVTTTETAHNPETGEVIERTTTVGGDPEPDELQEKQVTLDEEGTLTVTVEGNEIARITAGEAMRQEPAADDAPGTAFDAPPEDEEHGEDDAPDQTAPADAQEEAAGPVEAAEPEPELDPLEALLTPFRAALMAATTKQDVWTALATIGKKPEFTSGRFDLELPYADAWQRLEVMAGDGPKLVNIAKEPPGFQLWLAQATNPDEIEKRWGDLSASSAYSKLPPQARDDMIQRKNAKLRRLREQEAGR